jgi:hypothetical protein
MFDQFITAAQRHARACYPQNHEEEEAERLVYSIRRIVDDRGPDYIRDAISLTEEELFELYQIVKPSLEQKGPGRSGTLARIDRFFLLLLDLASGCTIKRVNLSVNLSHALTI